MAPQQQSLDLRTWGGKRHGAGRKPDGERARDPHARRGDLRPYHPVHVTFRVAGHVWNLRSERSFRLIDAALRGSQRRSGCRVVHYSVQGNHLHLIVEADGKRAFSNGIRALGIRLALGLNRMMGRTGPVFADRYNAHVLRTPAEVRNAVRYVLGNFESHAARRGEPRSTKGWVDPFSSAARKAPREAQQELFVEPATVKARTWSLRQAATEREPTRAGRNVNRQRTFGPGVRAASAPTPAQASYDGIALPTRRGAHAQADPHGRDVHDVRDGMHGRA
jgi:putative transposase